MKPWIEKYRPIHFEHIVLDPVNRQLFQNMIEYDTFPHLLLYGPPGTGKTTTIINLIQEYQNKRNIKNSGNIIHLNASDERGIDIIRNQIQQFVLIKHLFDVGLKFVVLDEVDYMTKAAQQALKELLMLPTTKNVRFCLICNYISKIDQSLQHEFICVRFNQLPKYEIFHFIKTVAAKENLVLEDSIIEKIHQMYGSDIRSMINFIQSGWTVLDHPIHSAVFVELLTAFRCPSGEGVRQLLIRLAQQYNCDLRDIFRYFFDYVLRSTEFDGNRFLLAFLDIVENIVHHQYNVPNDILLSRFCHLWRIFV